MFSAARRSLNTKVCLVFCVSTPTEGVWCSEMTASVCHTVCIWSQCGLLIKILQASSIWSSDQCSATTPLPEDSLEGIKHTKVTRHEAYERTHQHRRWRGAGEWEMSGCVDARLDGYCLSTWLGRAHQALWCKMSNYFYLILKDLDTLEVISFSGLMVVVKDAVDISVQSLNECLMFNCLWRCAFASPS